MLKGTVSYFKYNFCLPANETLLRLEQTPKLVIAAIDGHRVDGGLEVAMAADLRVARKRSGKCGLPEVSGRRKVQRAVFTHPAFRGASVDA